MTDPRFAMATQGARPANLFTFQPFSLKSATVRHVEQIVQSNVTPILMKGIKEQEKR
jgi:hypothetical protein